MVDVTKSEILAADVNAAFGEGTGLAVRSIMLDTIQRYYKANPSGTPAEKMALVSKLALEAAREHKDGVHLAGKVGVEFDKSLDLTSAQKELVGLAWQKILSSKNPEKVIAFMEDPELKASFKDLPSIKDTSVADLNKKITEAINSSSAWDLVAVAAGEAGIDFDGGPISKLKGLFERTAEKYGIMYHKDASGKKQEVGSSFKTAIEEVKKDLGKVSALDAGVKLAGVTLSDGQPQVQLTELAQSRANDIWLG